jgi:anti-sigma-K factor RskA
VDVQRYISSGIIENHVVGLVTDAEARDVEAAIAQYPEVKAAADAIRQDMEHYVTMWSKQPPAGIKKSLMEKLKNVEADPAPVEETPVLAPEPVVTEDDSYRPSVKLSPLQIWQYSAAAAVALLIVSVGFNFMYMNRESGYKSKAATLENNQTALTEERDTTQQKLQAIQAQMALIKDPGFRWIRMQAVGKHAGAFATICWNPDTKATYIMAQALPMPPADMQYQLWAIVNGKPIDAGVFEQGAIANDMQKVKEVAAAQVFAVTLEKKGGSPKPSLDQMFVAGKVSGI